MEATTVRNIEERHPATPEIGEQVDKVKQNVVELGRITGTRAKRKMHDLRERGAQLGARAREMSRETVRRRPVAVVAAAAGLGVLAGLLVRRNHG